MKFSTWLASALERHYPATPATTKHSMTLDVARNERFHFQVGIRQGGLDAAWMTLKVKAPKGWTIRIRRVGYIPMAHLNTPIMPTDADVEGREHTPGLVPDDRQRHCPALRNWVGVTPVWRRNTRAKYWAESKPQTSAICLIRICVAVRYMSPTEQGDDLRAPQVEDSARKKTNTGETEPR